MAFIRCGGGTAKLKATTLWSNSAPGSSFAAQTVNLSQSMLDFDFIRVSFDYSASSAEGWSVIYSPSILYHETVSLGARKDDSSSINDMRYRAMNGATSTTVSFTNSVQHTSSSQSTSASYIIPTSITGLKLVVE